MRAVDTTRNRPCRWGPTRALLWERWRTTWGFLVLALLTTVGIYVWYLVVNQPTSLEWLGFPLSLPFTITVLGVSFASSMASPVHRLRLPLSNARLAFAFYVYALVWPFLAFACLLTLMRALDMAGARIETIGQIAVTLVTLHILVRIVVSKHYLLAALLLVLVAAFVLMITGWVRVNLINWDVFDPVAGWTIAAAVALLAGFLVSWVTIARERSHGAAKLVNLALPSLPAVKTGKNPFAWPLGAQAWFESRRKGVASVMALAAFAVMGWLAVALDLVSVSPSVLQLMRVFALGVLPIVGVMIGCHETPEKAHRPVFFLARPITTYCLALARLLALAKVACALVAIAAAVEASYHLARHSCGDQTTAKTARAQSWDVSTVEDKPSDENHSVVHRGDNVALLQGRYLSTPSWGWMAVGFILLIWCCLASPGLTILFSITSGFIREFTEKGLPYALWLFAFVIFVLCLHGLTGRACAQHGLLRRRTLVLGGLLVTGVSALLFAGSAGFGMDVEFGGLLVILVLLSVWPFHSLPWFLYHERHQ